MDGRDNVKGDRGRETLKERDSRKIYWKCSERERIEGRTTAYGRGR